MQATSREDSEEAIMELKSEYQGITCKSCGWSGEVKDLSRTEDTLNGDEDGPVGLLCPKCKTQLGVHGWLDYEVNEDKACVDAHER
jgi:hypothetical protein